MCSEFKLLENELYYNLNGCHKNFICKYEIDKIKEIITNAHSIYLVGPRGTHERICSTYCGIYYEDIVDFISKCENCMRERIPHVNNSTTPIVPSYQRKKIIVDTIDMSIYSTHNDNYN
ncbi:hypothetical protein DMUE_3537 [Dictyocoela muelleri]|nr:hypothetical protein DMUE_3537 [Dictyocoela muelleri]